MVVLHRNVGRYELDNVVISYEVGSIMAEIGLSVVAVAKCVRGPA